METNYIESVTKQFEYYKQLGEKAIAQVSDEQLFLIPSPESNSVAIIVQHLAGNMLSRWTDFFTTDGEKEWRNRDAEFEKVISSKEELMKVWNNGWEVFFNVINNLKPDDLGKIIYIVFLAKLLASNPWQTLSIAKNQSKDYNTDKFSKEKSNQHFTDEFLKKKK